eukprot:3597577-Rhodomonas_salina.1
MKAFTVVPRPRNTKIITSKIVFKLKRKNCVVSRYKELEMGDLRYWLVKFACLIVNPVDVEIQWQYSGQPCVGPALRSRCPGGVRAQ